MPVFPDLGGLVEDVQLCVLRREHVVHAGAQLRRLVGVRGSRSLGGRWRDLGTVVLLRGGRLLGS